MNFDPITIIAIFIAFALGGILKGATGAGAPIITIPVIAAFYDVRIAVIIMVIPNLLTNIGQLYQFRKTILPLFFTVSFTEYENADWAMLPEVPKVIDGPTNEAVDW